ncbi:hypothetical protein [uncultured Subdoligranulum sp.]|uniref:hypothetical protein n=1 Tax=uncultured Subdoligranulum sp. TaxID=512298 RepID=UPI0025F84A1A|nr:hypothetical protein [uncultured Subdoligranulum sp.]
MADYTRYKTETLQKMLSAAERKYYAETVKSDLGWGAGMRLSKLPSLKSWERARQKVFDIKAELCRRSGSTIHK